jgi:hypothetical protein
VPILISLIVLGGLSQRWGAHENCQLVELDSNQLSSLGAAFLKTKYIVSGTGSYGLFFNDNDLFYCFIQSVNFKMC